MAKKSAIERNKKRMRLAKKYASKRERLKAIASNRELPAEERFAARMKLAQLPRNSSPVRVRNRFILFISILLPAYYLILFFHIVVFQSFGSPCCRF